MEMVSQLQLCLSLTVEVSLEILDEGLWTEKIVRDLETNAVSIGKCQFGFRVNTKCTRRNITPVSS